MANFDGITGDSQKYTLSNNVKKYSLEDFGFRQTKNGNFVLNYPVGDSPYDAKFRLKINVSKDFDKLQISLTDLSGMTDIDIQKLKDTDETKKLYQYIFDDLINREILVAE